MPTSHPSPRICPVEIAGALETPLRRLVQNPLKILSPYIRPGDKVLDFGCGPGFFTFDIARLVGETGLVYAADLQEGMLERIREKILSHNMQGRVIPHKTAENAINLDDSVDFILAFYMIHELVNPENFFLEFRRILKPGGRLLIIEPNFHVTGNDFKNMLTNLGKTGFNVLARPKHFFSRSVLLQ